jgi:hypothetical protein
MWEHRRVCLPLCADQTLISKGKSMKKLPMTIAVLCALATVVPVFASSRQQDQMQDQSKKDDKKKDNMKEGPSQS